MFLINLLITFNLNWVYDENWTRNEVFQPDPQSGVANQYLPHTPCYFFYISYKYFANLKNTIILNKMCSWQVLNLQPSPYEGAALTSCATETKINLVCSIPDRNWTCYLLNISQMLYQMSYGYIINILIILHLYLYHPINLLLHLRTYPVFYQFPLINTF